MRSEGKHLVMRELNSSLLYTSAVREMGYTEIGIIVLDGEGTEKHYASHNSNSGEITDIVDYFKNPDIVVKVREAILLEILYGVETVKDNPLFSFLKYGPKFRPRIVDIPKFAILLARTKRILEGKLL